jgi:hypothetical protein
MLAVPPSSALPLPRESAFEYALSVVAAMGDAGVTQVPVDPTPEMVAAGVMAGGVPPELVRAIYAAMVRAAE